MKKKYEYIISDFAMEISIDKFWREKILKLHKGEIIKIGYEDTDRLPKYVKDYIISNKLSFYVEIVDECEEEYDEGLVIFKFTSAEFEDVYSFSGNNPNVV